MDFGLRDWLLIIGPVLVVAVLLHGFWRMRVNRNNIKMKLDKAYVNSSGDEPEADDLSMLRAELPNGGARVIEIPRQPELDLQEEVPVLMEPVDSEDVDAAPPSSTAVNASLNGLANDTLSASIKAAVEPVQRKKATSPGSKQKSGQKSATEPGPERKRRKTAVKNSSKSTAKSGDKESAGQPKKSAEARQRQLKAREAAAKARAQPPAEKPIDSSVEKHAAVSAEPAAAQVVEEHENTNSSASSVSADTHDTHLEKFVVVYVVARQEPFAGQALLEALMSAELRFVEPGIFYRIDESGTELFGLASAVEPGTFDLKTIAEITVPGVSLFLRVHELQQPALAFDQMIHVAAQLADELDGVLKDERRSDLSQQTIEHCRQDIMDWHFKNG